MRITEIKIVNTTGEELRVKAQITYTLKEQAVIPYDYRVTGVCYGCVNRTCGKASNRTHTTKHQPILL